jgi:hypothetical protein
MGGRGPNRKKANENGFYETVLHSKKGVYNCDKIFKERRHGLGKQKDKNFRLYSCYSDVNDASTLQWWMIHHDLDSPPH